MRWFEGRSTRTGWRRPVGVAMGMLLLALSGHVWAQATCTGNAENFTIQMPTQITVPRDTPVGTSLSGWMSSSMNQNWFNCVIKSLTKVTTVARTVTLTKSAVTISNGGVTYAVLNTNVPGVGVAVGFRAYINTWEPVFDLGTPVDGFGQYDGFGQTYGNATFTTGGQLSVMLVKTGPITPGTTSGGVFANGAVATTLNRPYVVQSALKTFSMTPTIVTVLACTTPNVTVSMGSYKSSAFTGVGSSTNPVSFNVALNSCPAGMNSIQYEFDAPGGVTDATNGVIALTGGTSAATGIGLKLMDSSNTALKFDTQYPLNSYNGTTGGMYTIPLKAAYYQTATSVTPGAANAVITFTMTYL